MSAANMAKNATPADESLSLGPRSNAKIPTPESRGTSPSSLKLMSSVALMLELIVS